jgi:hypothetical protein
MPFFTVYVEWWSSQDPLKGLVFEGGMVALRVPWASLVKSFLEAFL